METQEESRKRNQAGKHTGERRRNQLGERQNSGSKNQGTKKSGQKAGSRSADAPVRRERRQNSAVPERQGDRRRSDTGERVERGQPSRAAEKRNKNRSGAHPEKAGKKKKINNQDLERHLKERRKKKRRKLAVSILLVACLAVFCFSGFQLAQLLMEYYQGGEEYQAVRELAVSLPAGEDENIAEARAFSINFNALLQENPDTVAWIRFEEPSIISYPVVKSSDNKEYLTKTFQNGDNKLGAIFMDMRNSAPLADRNTFIYGHNMKVGGEMFSQLNQYADEDFCREHPYFYIYTPDGKVTTCKIFAASIVDASSEYYTLDFTSDMQFQEYLNMCRSGAFYPVDAEIHSQSHIVSLSTCTNVNDEERFLLQGVVVRQEKVTGGE